VPRLQPFRSIKSTKLSGRSRTTQSTEPPSLFHSVRPLFNLILLKDFSELESSAAPYPVCVGTRFRENLEKEAYRFQRILLYAQQIDEQTHHSRIRCVTLARFNLIIRPDHHHAAAHYSGLQRGAELRRSEGRPDGGPE